MPTPPRIHRYEQIADEIRAAILRGAYAPDGRLPSERRLVRAHNAQRNTVRQALGLLEREGRIASVGKSGWFVSEESVAPPERPATGGRTILVTFRRHESAASDTIANELSRTLAPRGMQVLRYDTASRHPSSHPAMDPDLTAQEIADLGADGVVMWPHGPVDARLLARIQATVPLVLVDRRVFGFESDSVRFDDLSGGRMVTEHLLAQGHRRIAFLGDEPFVESVQARWNGYRQALEEAGLVPDDNLTLLTQGQPAPIFTESLRLLLRGPIEPPTAVICSNDGVASELLLLLRAEGLRVPEDVAVTGFGNLRPSYLDLMGLTTLDQSFGELGHAAGSLLNDRLDEPHSGRGGPYREILLPMRLIVRASSGRHAP